jgi:hypothetical protein
MEILFKCLTTGFSNPAYHSLVVGKFSLFSLQLPSLFMALIKMEVIEKAKTARWRDREFSENIPPWYLSRLQRADDRLTEHNFTEVEHGN